MEGYRDVMLSEPPAPHVNYGRGGTGGALENYKGILLCDRPHEHKVVQRTDQQPFLPPGSTDMGVGLQPSLEAQKRNEDARNNLTKKKVNGPTAQQQHRKQLRALNDAKVREKLDAVERAIDDEQRNDRFRQKQATLRKVINGHAPADQIALKLSRGNPHDQLGVFNPAGYGAPSEEEESELQYRPPSEAPSLPPLTNDPGTPVAYVRTPPDSGRQASKPATPPRKAKSMPKSSKPKWAMTEDEALDAELDETNDLIEFAASLDYKNYMDDYEIREALSIMRERVDELREEEKHERTRVGKLYSGGDDDAVSVMSSASKLAVRKNANINDDRNAQLERDWDNVSRYSNLSERKRQVIGDEAMVLAEKILQSSDGLRAVHSKQSLGKVLEELTHKTYNEDKGGEPSARPTPVLTSMAQPIRQHANTTQQQPSVQVQHGSDASGHRVLTHLQKSRDYVQNLPYLYRCPSI
eukprot:NODE_422_length_1684_cov_265.817737_g329_i0.p1 GENE.NODE_422_length_1684_cov_265.817737_g329_i0~~NODE_422_length_1684_cov_265.817737_g329_i0.p1  ORF type:complete len:468 (+),score=120.75 NODE_422_length_1684_cov_265.817737_g329_i0:106-1509(+)